MASLSAPPPCSTSSSHLAPTPRSQASQAGIPTRWLLPLWRAIPLASQEYKYLGPAWTSKSLPETPFITDSRQISPSVLRATSNSCRATPGRMRSTIPPTCRLCSSRKITASRTSSARTPASISATAGSPAAFSRLRNRIRATALPGSSSATSPSPQSLN